MYTVLLIDDEVDILNSLKNIIDWPVYGIENVLTACDGLDALQMLESHPVNLLITDIDMPNMDGIMLLKQVREKFPLIRCIILSSYSDFSYAKEAISLGVENYLLKPIKSDELENSVRKCLDNLSMHKHIMRSLFMDNVLYRWITNDISNEELMERSRHIQVNIYFRNYCVILLKASQQNTFDTLLQPFLLQFQNTYDTYHLKDYKGWHVVILGGHTITQNMLYDALQSTLSQTAYPHDFIASIGTIAMGSEQVSLSYQRAADALLLCHTLSGQHITLADPSIHLSITDYQLGQISSLLKQALDSDTEISTFPLFEELFMHIEVYSLSEINSFINSLSVRLFRFLVSQGLVDSQAEESFIVNFYHFEEVPTKEALYKCFDDLLTINLILIKRNMKRLSPICISAMQYVSDNFANHVSIKDFCNRHNANASYLGFLFKKETGIYFNDYINQIRINHAILLLKNTNYKVSQISIMCGFGNTSYFILCFKKRTGLSPTNFKQLLTQTAEN